MMGRQGDSTSAGHPVRPRRLWRSVALIGVGTVALIVLGSGSALAGNVHPFLETFGSANQPSFASAAGLAIDQSNGDVLVIERGAGAISRYHEDGTPAPFSGLGSNVIGGLSFGGAPEVQIAVDESGGPADGDIYVTQGGAGLDIFGADGSLLGQLTASSNGPFGEICGVGVDPAGAVYVSDFFQGMIHKYVPTGNPPSNADNTANFATTSGGPCTVAAGAGTTAGFFFSAGYLGALTKYDSGTGEPKYEVVGGGTTTETVDPANGNVYVASGSEVSEYDASGPSSANLLSTISLEGSAEGVAVNGATGNVYVARGERIDVYGPAVLLPGAITGPASEVTNTTAKISGGVNPEGTETSYQFEYGTSRAYGEKTPVPAGSVGNDSSFHLEEAQLSGLQPNTTYHYRIDGINANGTATGADGTFTTTGPPLVETTGSPIRTATTAHLEGRVDPERASATYHFEYGTAGPCNVNPCIATEPVAAGSGDEIELVSQQISGLASGTIYHYRLVADNGNSAGPAYGEDMTVTTRASNAPLSHGDLPGPPGSDRNWEQVNQPDTGGNPVWRANAIADDGDKALYQVGGGTPNSDVGTFYDTFFTERTSDGWLTSRIFPSRAEAPGSRWRGPAGSSDLSNLVAVNEEENTGNRSIWHLSPGSSPRRVITLPGASIPGDAYVGVPDSGTRVVATLIGPADPSYPGTHGINLFDLTTGTPRLISLLPGNVVSACGVKTEASGRVFQMFGGTEEFSRRSQHWISADGSLAFFTSPGDECNGPVQLYMRDLESDATKLVSKPPLSGPSCGAAFIKSTPDAVFFWSQSRLVPNDSSVASCAGFSESSERGGDVYKYEIGSGALDCVTCTSEVAADVHLSLGSAAADEEIAVASDGSRVYFESLNKLVPGAAAPGLYRDDVATGNLRYLAPGGGSAAVGDAAGSGEALTPDGSVLVFPSDDAALNPIKGSDNGGTRQFYRYDDQDRSLTCISCPQDGDAPRAGEEGLVGGLLGTGEQFAPNITPIDQNGDVIFTTPTALVPADQNTAKSVEGPSAGTDAYEWRDGRQLLLTDGLTNWSGQPPTTVGVTPSGQDVYIDVAEKLTPDALDAYPRLYDARIGGGFEFPQPPPPCPLEVCQGAPKGAPTSPAPGTAGFSGPVNPKPRFHHGKRHRHRRNRNQHHHHKKIHKHHQRGHDQSTRKRRAA